MTVQADTRRAGPFVGTGLSTDFPFAFKALQTYDVAVYVAKNGEVAETLLSPREDYVVKLNENQDTNPGGTVTLNTPLASGMTLAIISDAPYTQSMRLTNHDGMYPETLNLSADHIVILCQQLKERIDRTIVVPVTSRETPEQLLVEILDVAHKAGQYAQDAQDIKDNVEEIRADVLRMQTEVQGLLASAELVKASVDQSEAEVSRMYALFEAAQDKLNAVYAELGALTAISENLSAVRAVGDDLLGLPIMSLDLGLVTQPARPINTPAETSAIVKVAQNLDKLIQLADQLADQGGIETMSENLDEIQKTDYDKVLDDGVSE